MNLYAIPSSPLRRWVIRRSLLFALLGLLTLDGGFWVTSAFATVQLSPSSLTFTAKQNGASPTPQTMNLSDPGTSIRPWTLMPSVPWLTVSPPAGTISTETDHIVVGANVSGLGQGSYPASITVMTFDANGTLHKFVVPVSLTLTAPSATIGSLPTNLAFSGTVGGANPLAQPFALTNTGGGTLSWTLSDNAAWLQLNTASGTTTTETDTISASVTTNGLAAGTYNAIITVTAAGSTNSPRQIPVSLTLKAATLLPAIGLSRTSLGFAGTVGGTIPSDQSLAVSNVGGVTLTWSASDNSTWLTLSPVSGTNNGTVTASVNLTGLTAGTHTATITVAASGATTKTIPVTLTLAAATLPPAIGLSRTSLGFAGTVGGTIPSAQSLAVSNVGGGTLTWSASDNSTWLTLSPVSGTNSGTVTASVNLTGLTAGTRTATITVAAIGATTKTIPVTLTLAAASGTIGSLPTNLAFSGTVGGANPSAQPFALTNIGGGTLSWTLIDNAAWLLLNTASGTTTTETDTISASVTTSGLAAGTYNAIITVTAAGSTTSPRQIPVSLTLRAAIANQASLTWNANSETDLTGYKVYEGTASGSYGAPVATLPKTTTSYIATGLQTGTTYFFTITAYDSLGYESVHSGEVSKSIY